MASVNPVDEKLSILLSCYLDGALSPDELHEVVLALDSDLDAIAEFRRLKDVRRTVRMLPMLDVPPHLLPAGHLSEELSAFLDGELATSEVAIVSSHIESCVECRLELGDLDRSRIAVRALPGIEPPAFLDVRREAKSASRRTLPSLVAVGAGAAAVALAFTIGPFGGSSEPPAISISDFDARHAAVASVPAAVQLSIENTAP